MSEQNTTTSRETQHCTDAPTDVTTPDDKDKIDQSAKRGWFEGAVKKTLNIPSGYVKVAVLVLRWHEDIDDYAAGHTTERLKDLFSGRLGYSYKEVKLGTQKNPQNTLRTAISNHIDEHDGPNNLLIVFYTGHGLVQLTRGKTKTQKDRFFATAYWNTAEEPFLEKSTEADVLAILDCCFASNAHKGQSNERRTYELLAACGKDDTTPGPGTNSFTNAFIQTIEKLLDQDSCGSFTTTKLLDEMNGRQPRPKLLNRLHKDDNRHVHLARLDESYAKENERRFQERPPEKANLKLRFSLEKPDASRDQLEKLGENLPRAFDAAGIPLRWIEWVKMEQRDPVQIFRHAVKHVTRNQRNQRHRSNPEMVHQQEASPDTRKRTRAEASSLPASKRRV
ncbi:hypothetical protein EJ02DRAFT_407390 [Clathrospora elynae]|uniref:Peptidase C14 caspase domain-containing protein n=1 Tax=Clathrospora elynae TaxID=706981 RepID=A0A6A5SN01_9PLEO|nr:hypothetical protein EJ02DRAFT_407390 [Clathrospora elynae]